MGRMCPVCGKREIGPRAAMCDACGTREMRAYYHRRGICPTCKKNTLFGEERTCIECRAKIAEKQIKRYYEQYEKIRVQASESHKRSYARYKSEGICVRCRKRKARPGTTSCEICTIKRRNRELQDIPRSERVSHGLCYFCGQPLDREGRCCKKCAERCTNTIAPYRPNGNDEWRRANKLIFRKRDRDEEQV